MKLQITGLTCSLAVIVLAGCSNSVPEPESSPSTPTGVYEFKTPAYGAKGELRINLPADLTETVPEGGDLLVTSVTAKARELSSLEYCAVEYAVTYADGALDELKKPRTTRQEAEKMNQDQMTEQIRFELGSATTNEYVADYQSMYGTPPPESDVADFESALTRLTNDYINSGMLSEYTETSDVENVTMALSDTGSIYSIGELEPSDPAAGRYMSDDFKTLTSVQLCAGTPTDGERAETFKFPYMGASSKPERFADIEVSVMRDGSLTVVESDVASYTLDTNGSWLVK